MCTIRTKVIKTMIMAEECYRTSVRTGSLGIYRLPVAKIVFSNPDKNVSSGVQSKSFFIFS